MAVVFLWLGLTAAGGQAQQPAAGPDSIIVTGERVKRSLKQTSSSVSVVTEREIEASGADRVDQMLAQAPNVQLGNGSQGPAIRGLDTTGPLQALPAFLGGNRPRTTLIIDGRRATYNEFVFGAAPLWDVQRVEVFRSPQTTTQGQNSIAGAIFVETNDPSFSAEYRARLIAGNYHMREVSAAASGPLSGDVALRVSGDLRYARTTSLLVDRLEDADPNHDVFGVGRVKLLVKPRGLAASRLLLTYAHNQSQAPQMVGLTPPFKERRDNTALYGTFRINSDTLTARAQHALGGHVSADVTLSAGRSTAQRLALTGFGEADNRARDWSAEGVINWTSGGLKAVGGLSRSHVELRQKIDLSLLSGIGRFADAQDSYGIFGEATFPLFPRTTVTAGLRYQLDRQQRNGALDSATGPVPLDFYGRFHAWLPKVSLAYDFNDRVRGGLLVQRAYNPGGTTLRFDIGRPDDFGAETLWDYEAFVRAEPLAGLHASANVFYYAIRNAQRSADILIFTQGGLAVGFADLFNAPKARSYGGEAELSWRVQPQLWVRVSAGLLRSRLVDAGADHAEFRGNEFARTPHFSAAAAVDWRANNRVRLSVQARRHSGYYARDLNRPGVRVPGSFIVHARAEYRLPRVTAFAYVRNLFDKFALLDRFENRSASAEDPRMIGLGVETGF